MISREPLTTDVEWTFPLLEDYYYEIARIAKDKFGVEVGTNQIEIITAEQMISAYTSHAMPLYYEHWTMGLRYMYQMTEYKSGKSGLAYEVVINSTPVIAYLMEDNTMAQQILIIGHACFGHHWIYANNYLFKEWTNPDEILRFLGYAKVFIARQEELWGIDEVEDVIDACHCLNTYVDRYKKPIKLSKKKQKEHDVKRRIDDELSYNSIWDTIPTEPVKGKEKTFKFPKHPEENILKFIEQHAPNIPDWKREIIKIIRKLGQYFYPQMFTKILNEGFACFLHYHLCYALFDEGLIGEGFMLELLSLHTSVISQGDFYEINPYKLGFKMLMDIKRISIDPTEEDKDWFRDQDWVGNGEWMENVKYAVANFKDESIILQYLSPKLMRDFSMFSLLDDSRDDMLEVTDVHDMEGYKHIRETLSNMYRLNTIQPDIKVTGVDVWGDRRLTLTHYRSERHLNEEHALEAMKAVQLLWDYDVELVTKDSVYSKNDGRPIIEHTKFNSKYS